MDETRCYHMPNGPDPQAPERPEFTEQELARVPRMVAERRIGPIREGMAVDHACGDRLCINPRHLRLVTITENSGRRR